MMAFYQRCSRLGWVALLGLAACQDQGLSGPTSSSTSAGPSSVIQAAPLQPASLTQVRNAVAGGGAASLPLGLGCAWTLHSDVDKANVAFPDEQAKYWVAFLPAVPQLRVKISGKFPKARYFSFNAYDPALRPTDALADYQIQPKPGSDNPFVTASVNSGGGYEAYFTYGASPNQKSSVNRAVNTFYSGEGGAGPVALPNGGLVAVIYRIYVSEAGTSFDGGVGLPTLTLETADGRQSLGTLPNCTEGTLPSLAGTLPDLGLNQKLLALDYPDQLALSFPVASNPPRSNRFYGLTDVVTATFEAQLGRNPLPPAAALGGGGFLSNVDNAYTTSTFSRQYGSVALMRAKAPTWRGASNTALGNEQLRYWSVCGNEFVTQRYTRCSSDFQTPLDAQGFFTVVIGDAAQRTANVSTNNGFTFLEWGPYPDHVLIYRHMLPNPAFEQAIQNVPKGTPLKTKMGDFSPEVTYCNWSILRNFSQPAEAFAACRAQSKSPAAT